MKTIKIHDFPMPDDVALICDMQNEFYGYPLGERLRFFTSQLFDRQTGNIV